MTLALGLVAMATLIIVMGIVMTIDEIRTWKKVSEITKRFKEDN